MSMIIDNETSFSPDFSLEEIAETVLSGVLAEEGINEPCEASLLVTDGPGIRELNRDYRELDEETDVLSFPAADFSSVEEGEHPWELGLMEKDPDTKEYFLGDIALNWERVTLQAREYGHSEKREAAFLIAHSLFHLLGYDHMTPGEEEIMLGKQESVLSSLGILRE